ncbi:MAG TPA: hypothetical protein DHV24_10705, partial [Candidatus Margulisbacteria bacterium]|nr:hypothetical protein [Candidatus Margulisiibacteriota bacterium]
MGWNIAHNVMEFYSGPMLRLIQRKGSSAFHQGNSAAAFSIEDGEGLDVFLKTFSALGGEGAGRFVYMRRLHLFPADEA